MVQTLVNGLMMAGDYAIVALGLALIFGVMRAITMAHGAFLMAGMCTYTVGLPRYLSTKRKSPVKTGL